MRKLVIVTVALFAACGTDSVSLDDYPVASRDALCRYLVKCGDVEDVETCRKINIGVTIHLSTSELAALDMGKIEYDGENAQKCFDALAGRSCDPTAKSSRVVPEACRDIFSGALRAGASCADDAECSSRECDVPACNMACCTGACVGDAVPARAKLGESCESARCEDTSFCDTDLMMCVALKSSDAFCTVTDECAFGLGCLSTGTCAVLPGPGAPCSGACRDEGTTCSPTSRTCVEVALVGEACNTNSDCSPVYRCDMAAKRCVAGIALGAACTGAQRCADDRAFCEVPQGQTMGACALPKPDGSPCQRDAHCESLSCDPLTLMCRPEPICI